MSCPPIPSPQYLNVHDVKTHLSRYLARVEQGETIILCRRNQPVAELRPIKPKRVEPRPIGLERGQFVVGPAFDDPLPEEWLGSFVAPAEREGCGE